MEPNNVMVNLNRTLQFQCRKFEMAKIWLIEFMGCQKHQNNKFPQPHYDEDYFPYDKEVIFLDDGSMLV